MKTVSKSALITTSPSIALIKSPKDDLTVFNSLLNLISSYYKTVFIDSSYLTLCFLLASSTSKSCGNLFRIYWLFSLSISSGEAPWPPTALGNNESTVPQTKLVSIIALLISALSWSPKTSVASLSGRFLMYSL